MIERITVRGWQSLVSLDLTLARFTVIVGPSSTGKSALIRALRAVASNVSGTDKITSGRKNAAITVQTGDASVTLEYGRYSNDTAPGWFYRLLAEDGTERVYTKLNRSVPAVVTKTLRIDPVPAKGVSINFAGQYDGPFLLQDSGASVARVLGELTQVDRIFEAGREANRRRNVLAATARTREADLAGLTQAAQRFTELPARLKALEAAEQAAQRAGSFADKASRLRTIVGQLDVVATVLARTSVLPDVPDDDAVQTAQRRLDRFKTACQTWTDQIRAAAAWDAEAVEQTAVEDRLHTDLRDTLTAAGICPTCRRAM